jgi:anti-anti-sigma regulatory factor
MQNTENKPSKEIYSQFGLLHPSLDSPNILISEMGVTDHLFWDAIFFLSSGRFDELVKFSIKALEKATESSYLLGLGVSRLEGKKEIFEDLAVEYAVNFGVNPPNWLDTHSKSAVEINNDVIIHASSLSSDTIIETTIKMETPWPIRIDLSDVLKYDNLGIDLFNESMNGRLQRKEKTVIFNGQNIIDMLIKKLNQEINLEMKAGWEFVFNYYKLTGKKLEFDSLMEQFVMVGGHLFDWDDLSEIDAVQINEKVKSKGMLVGEKLSILNGDFAKKILKSPLIQPLIKSGDPFIIDFAFTRSASLVDFISLSQFFKELSSSEITLHFFNVNEIIQSLFKIFGVDKKILITSPGEP